MPSPKKAVQISDVARPGKSEPSATSKSVLVTNRPLMQDPMMAKKPDTEEPTPVAKDEPATRQPVAPTTEEPAAPAPENAMLQPVHQLVLKPPTDEERAARDAETAEKPTEVSTDTPAPVVGQDITPAAAKSVESDAVVTDELSIPSNPDAEEAQADDAEVARLAALDTLVETEKYFLPVDSVELQRAHQFIIYGLLFVVVFGFIALDLALDAGILHLNGVTALTNFFSN